MVDNIDVTPGSGATIAADDVGGALHQRVKLSLGANGTAVDAGAGAGAVGTDTQRVTLASDDPAVASLATLDDLVLAEDAAAGSGDKGIMALAVRRDSVSASGADGDYVTLNIDANGRLYVASTAAGDVAHDGADSGNPAKVGAKAIAGLSTVTLVSAADRTNLYAGLDGSLITRPHCGLEDIVSGVASNTDGSSTEVIATAGSGVKQYLTSVILINTSSSMIYVEMKSGTTVKARIPVPATSGAIFNPPVPLPPNAADEAWNFDASAATTTLYCTAIGFKSKV